MQILVKPNTAAMPGKNEKNMRNKRINICINPTILHSIENDKAKRGLKETWVKLK